MYYGKLPKEGFYECILCGEETNGTAFCKDCWSEYSNEELLDILNEYEEDDDDDDEYEYCENCGAPSYGYRLCKKCYYAEQNNSNVATEEFFQIETDEKEVADYRQKYPAKIRAKDGHYLRSNNEKVIDDKLYENRIWHEYERRYKAKDGRTYYPDFYLPDYNLFIEFFGVEDNQIKNDYKRTLFLEDKNYNFEFIEKDKIGVLEETIEDIIEKHAKAKKERA